MMVKLRNADMGSDKEVFFEHGTQAILHDEHTRVNIAAYIVRFIEMFVLPRKTNIWSAHAH